MGAEVGVCVGYASLLLYIVLWRSLGVLIPGIHALVQSSSGGVASLTPDDRKEPPSRSSEGWKVCHRPHITGNVVLADEQRARSLRQ